MQKHGKKSALNVSPSRGSFLVNLDPTIGSEIKKTRPALIIQNDIENENSSLTIVAPISSKFDERTYPTEVLIHSPEGGLQTDSVVQLNQVCAVDKKRLIRLVGKLMPESIERVEQALLISFGLVDWE